MSKILPITSQTHYTGETIDLGEKASDASNVDFGVIDNLVISKQQGFFVQELSVVHEEIDIDDEILKAMDDANYRSVLAPGV